MIEKIYFDLKRLFGILNLLKQYSIDESEKTILYDLALELCCNIGTEIENLSYIFK